MRAMRLTTAEAGDHWRGSPLLLTAIAWDPLTVADDYSPVC